MRCNRDMTQNQQTEKRIYKCLIIAFLSILSSATLYGQVEAPALLCISQDSLYWELPSNNCGPFNAYNIYASQNINGPYTILATITDPGQTTYLHDDPGVSTWYYYLESDFDCPGEIVLQSDTLDNDPPVGPTFEYASVVGNDVIIGWGVSPSPETIGYIISRNISGQGTVAVDTVFDVTEYIDAAANPTQFSETYFLEALDACGNRSLISAPHRTMLLQSTEPINCNRTAELSWTRYEGWEIGIASQEVWVSQDGGAETLVATIDGSATSYSFTEVVDAANYCFRIRAMAQNEDWFAYSNEVCVLADVIQSQQYLLATNASVNGDGSVTLSWIWNDDAELSEVSILRATDGTNFNILESDTPPNPLLPSTSYTDIDNLALDAPVFYQLRTVDDCGTEVLSGNTVGTMHLQVILQNGGVGISWTPYINALTTIDQYNLYRIDEDGSNILVGSFDNTTTSAIDLVDFAALNQLQACYFVEAVNTFTAPDGTTVDVSSFSNRACASQDARVYVPTAFSPNSDGRNDEFFPYLQYGAPAEYQLDIYDRWGGLRFRSTDINQGWDGMTKGREAPTGLYLYHLYLRQANGSVTEMTGEVNLLR
jgi:gliding motility-associated-like protein